MFVIISVYLALKRIIIAVRKRKMRLRLLRHGSVSSVARGRGGSSSPPHWPEEYAKYPVFSTFEADFCTKNGNSSPNGIGDEIWSRTLCDIDQKHSLSARMKAFFGDHLNFDRKTVSILVKTFFFAEITLIWSRKPT